MQGSDAHPGLMPLAMSRILAIAERANFQVAVAYYEVYLDRCYDLLTSEGAEISVLEGNDGKIQLRGLSQKVLRNLDEFHRIFMNGRLRRQVGQTGLNDTSSRSHGVLMVTVASQSKERIFGKLNLIDLAGNEDNRRTGNEGHRLVESSRINQDLFVLSNVISALSSNEPRVPYRDSKLTRILQDSLGGTSRAIMIVCLNPRSYQEAAHTLIIAARTRQIPNLNSEKKEETQSKVNMNSKLQLWLEGKGKLSSVSPSPSKTKLLFYTPSHHQMNHSRRMAKNLPRDTQKARRVLVLHQPNHGPEKENQQVAASPLQFRDHTTINKSLSSCYDLNVNNTSVGRKPESLKHSGSGDGKLTDNQKPMEARPPPCVEENKENLRNIVDVTPASKHQNKSSSPPLSERLYKLRDAMRDLLLQPPVYNARHIEAVREATPSTGAHVQVPSTEGTKMELSPSNSPSGTPVPFVTGQNDDDIGTPLEKLSKKSSGIKNTVAKELLQFLNTASREELIELKGIGERRAAHILSLREEDQEPLKEIEDLEKIGISQKQAQSLFKETARHLLFA
ncbi:hypothetical protein KP509_27G013700 [Ceratopteris richardii]|nr:hypothetical protein KP509_27G013700 [Ceratopteris richardii]